MAWFGFGDKIEFNADGTVKKSGGGWLKRLLNQRVKQHQKSVMVMRVNRLIN